MKNKQTYLAGGALIVLALLYYFTQTGRVDTRAIDTEHFTFDQQAISRITAFMPTDTLVMYREADLWMLDNYPVDTSRIATFLNLFSELKVDRRITNKAEKLPRYELDQQGTRLAFSNTDGDTLMNLIVGKRGANYQENFVRKADEQTVYAVRSNLGRYRKMKTADFWDKSMTNLSVDAINNVLFTGEYNYRLNREGPVWTYDNEAVDLDKVTGMLRSLEHLRATNFAETISEENPLYQSIHITLDTGDEIQLNFYLKDDKATTLLARASGHEKVFEYPKSGLNRFKKELKDLQSDPPPETSAADS